MKKNALKFIVRAGLCLYGMVPWGLCESLSAQSTLGPVAASIRKVTQLCYRERIHERVKAAENVNTMNLTLTEKLLFRNKEQTLYHSCMLDENQLPVRTTYYESSHGVYPDWYIPPTYTVENADGLKSWFTANNSYLPGGWAGATFKETEHGSYQSDARIRGARSFSMNHTSQSQEAYNRFSQYVGSFGFLHDVAFTVPDKTVLKVMALQGYEVYETEDFISVQNHVIKVYWKVREKTVMQEIHNANNETIIVITSYKFNESFGEFLKEKEITRETLTFENGNCAEKVMEITFSDYSLQCTPEFGFRVKKPISKEDHISIYPNPANDFLTVTVPEYSGDIHIRMYSNQGLLVQRYSEQINNQVMLDISPLTPGNYTISIQAGSVSWQSSFIKL